MRNLKLEIEYEGTDYCGWQVQKSLTYQATRHTSKSIQETIEKVLSRILQEEIKLIGSGRTDAGVHALAQVANFKTSSSIPLGKLKKALNGILPSDIAVTGIEEAAPDFHARFCAKSKVYRYTILNGLNRSALLKDKVYFCPYALDVKLIQRISRCLLGRHDFKAFCASASNARDTVRTIKRITVKKLPYPLYALLRQGYGGQSPEALAKGDALRYTLKESPLIIIDIEADGFLYNMVRTIAGTLVEIGRGKFAADTLRKALHSRNRKFVGPTAPACGLYLLEVKY